MYENTRGYLILYLQLVNPIVYYVGFWFVKRLLSILTVIVVFASACKKYEDGPAISLRSRKERVANTWVYEKIIKNGEDVTSQTVYNIAYQARYTFTKSGGASLSFVDLPLFEPINGSWGFSNNDEQIFISFDGIEGTARWEILRLKENELWYRLTGKDPLYSGNGTDEFECHLRPE